jgi:hypothetical protein
MVADGMDRSGELDMFVESAVTIGLVLDGLDVRQLPLYVALSHIEERLHEQGRV